MKRRLAVHISISGGIDKGLERAKDLGCSNVQLFSHNPRGWVFGKIDPAEITRFRTFKSEFPLHYETYQRTNESEIMTEYGGSVAYNKHDNVEHPSRRV